MAGLDDQEISKCLAERQVYSMETGTKRPCSTSGEVAVTAPRQLEKGRSHELSSTGVAPTREREAA